MRVVFGYPLRHADRPCAIDVAHPEKTLCGLLVEFLPPTEGFDRAVPPVNLHDRCRRLMAGADAVLANDADPFGVCSVCAGEVELAAGVVKPHRRHIVKPWGVGPWGPDCDGAWLLPEDHEVAG